MVYSGVERTSQTMGSPPDFEGDTRETEGDHDDLCSDEVQTLLDGGIDVHPEDANRENDTVEQGRKDQTGERPLIRAQAVREERGAT